MSKILNPFISLFFLIILGSCAFFFHLSELNTAKIFIFYFSAVTLINPANGINLLLLILPFCLGDSKMPFYNGIELLIYWVILSGLIHLFLRKEFFKTNRFKFIAGFGILLLFSFPVSFPLDPKMHWILIKTYSLKDIFAGVLCPNEESSWYYFRALLNHLSAVGLFMVAALFFRDATHIQKTLKCMTILAGIIFSIAWLMFFGWIQTPEISTTFLTLQLLGIYRTSSVMYCFAFNQGYWCQYIACVIPMSAALLLFTKEKSWAKLVIFFVVIAALLQIPYTYQRGPVLGIVVAFILLFFFAFYLSDNKKKLLIIIGSIGLSLFLIFLFFDLVLAQKSILLRLMHTMHAPEPRKEIWKVAWQMILHHPLLGVGLGKFHYFFQYYCPMAGVPWAGEIPYIRSHAHNLYLHILAEQGIIGFSVWISASGYIIWKTILFLKKKIASFEVLALLGTLASFLAFGIGQYMFYLRIMESFFWIILGLLTCFIPEDKIINFSKKFYISFFISFGILILYRLYSAFSFVL